jgi:3,4-dihydroxy 2-butanone 4-phosphate synthase/GTP cyclohydrolase II
MKDDGSMARLPDLIEFAQAHQLKIGTIADLIQYRSQTESIVLREGVREFISPWGRFNGVVYRDTPSNCLHLALVNGDPQSADESIVRVHEPVTVLDLLDIDQSTHSWPLSKALQVIANAPCGVAVLLNAAGIAAPNELKWLTQFEKLAQLDQRSDQTSASPSTQSGAERKTDFRSYGIGAQILKDLGVRKMRLLANSSRVPSLSGYQLEIVDHIPYANTPT